jgi:hypothetical protein
MCHKGQAKLLRREPLMQLDHISAAGQLEPWRQRHLGAGQHRWQALGEGKHWKIPQPLLALSPAVQPPLSPRKAGGVPQSPVSPSRKPAPPLKLPPVRRPPPPACCRLSFAATLCHMQSLRSPAGCTSQPPPFPQPLLPPPLRLCFIPARAVAAAAVHPSLLLPTDGPPARGAAGAGGSDDVPAGNAAAGAGCG